MTREHVGARSLVRAVPVWAWLAAIVVVSAGVRFLLARGMVAPWIMVDELVYSELAKSFATHGHFAIRGSAAGISYGFVYPVLISPAYRLFAAVPDAYTAAKAINCVVMSLGAIPAYFLARRVLDEPLALVAAALAVAIPSLLYTGTLMTENAFYPLFLCVAFVLVRMLERPTVLNQLGVLALCLLAYGTRQQALALFPAVLTAPLLMRGLRRFAALYAGAGVIAAAVLVEAARGTRPLSLLGAYETAGHHGYSVAAIAKWLLWHVAELDLYLGIVPVAAFVVVAFAWRRLEPAQRAFMAGTGALTVWLVLEVAAYATLPGVTRVEERNTFYVAPFFVIALLLWVQLGAPRPRTTALLAAGGAGLLVSTLPYPRLIGPTTTSDTLALVPWWKLQEQGLGLHHVRLVVTVCALAAAALFLLVPRSWALVLPLAVLAYFAIVQQPIQARATSASRAARDAGIGFVPVDWLDRTVGRDADIGMVWAGRTDPHAVWENEFFNRSVGPVYDAGSPLPGNLASKPLANGVSQRLVLSDGTLDVRGATLASDAAIGLNLWRAAGRPTFVTRVTGLHADDNWSGPVVVYRRAGCAGGSLHVDVLGDPSLFSTSQTVRANGVAHRVRPGVRTGITVPLRNCTARFLVSPTKVPGGVDRRRLGVHFLTFAYSR
jgi:hypothetical protein